MYDSKSQIIKSMLNEIETKLKIQTSKPTDNYQNNFNKPVNLSKNYEGHDNIYSSNFRANPQHNFSTSIIGSNSYITGEKLHEKDSKKIFEKDVEIYFNNIKSELKLTIDNFYREIGEIKYFSNEISIVKQNVNDNKKLILIFQEDFEKKLYDVNMKLNFFKPLNDEYITRINDNHQRITILDEKLKEVISNKNVIGERKFDDNSSEIKDILNRLMILEKNCEEGKSNKNELKKYTEKLNEIEKTQKIQIENMYKNIEKEFDEKFQTMNNIQFDIKNNLSNLEERYRNDRPQLEIMKKIVDEFDNFKNMNNSSKNNFEENLKKIKHSNEQNIFSFENKLKDIFANVEKQEVRTNELEESYKKYIQQLKTEFSRVDIIINELKENVDSTQGNFLNIDNKIKVVIDNVKTNEGNINNLGNKIKNYENSINEFEILKIESSEQFNLLKNLIKQQNEKDENEFNKINERLNEIDETWNEKNNLYKMDLQKIEENCNEVQKNFNEFKKKINSELNNIMTTCSEIDNLSSEAELMKKSIEDLTESNEDLIQNYNESVEKNKMLQKCITDLEQKIKLLNNDYKDQNDSIKSFSTNFDEKYIKIAEEILTIQENCHKIELDFEESKENYLKINESLKNNKFDKDLNDEFKQEIINRLLKDEKKFAEFLKQNTNLEHNLTLIQKRIDTIEKQITSSGSDNHIHSSAINGCEVHSFRDQFILKGKEEQKIFIKEKDNQEQNILIKSNLNDININQNINSERISEKYKMNIEYLSCHPLEYISIKDHFKGYLPKNYFMKRNQVDIIEASFEIEGKNDDSQQELNKKSEKNSYSEDREHVEKTSNKGENDLYALEGNESIFCDEDDDFDSKDENDSDPGVLLISEEDFKKNDKDEKSNLFMKKDKNVEDFFK